MPETTNLAVTGRPVQNSKSDLPPLHKQTKLYELGCKQDNNAETETCETVSASGKSGNSFTRTQRSRKKVKIKKGGN